MKLRVVFSKDRIEKPLARLTKKTERGLRKTWNNKSDFTTDTTEIQGIIRY